MSDTLSRFILDETGVTAIQYGVIAACVALAILAVTANVAFRLNTTFARLESAIGHEVLIDPD